MNFAWSLAKKCEAFKGACEARPKLPEVLPSALETFQSMAHGSDTELWQFVNLKDIFTYLRGGKNLLIPPEWLDEVPRKFPVACSGTG